MTVSEWCAIIQVIIVLATGCPAGASVIMFALRYGKGYDACFVIDGAEEGVLQEAAELYSPESGRVLSVFTTQPGIQIYTGNWLEGCPEGKSGGHYSDYDGVAMECQKFPNTPNRPEYPSAVLRPGEVYEEAIIYAFSVRK